MRWGDGKHNDQNMELLLLIRHFVVLLTSRVVLAPVALCKCALRWGGGNTGCFHCGSYPIRKIHLLPWQLQLLRQLEKLAGPHDDDGQSCDWYFPATFQTQSRLLLICFFLAFIISFDGLQLIPNSMQCHDFISHWLSRATINDYFCID